MLLLLGCSMMLMVSRFERVEDPRCCWGSAGAEGAAARPHGGA